jgi:monoterpene epsilon-lactone hydrolase
MASLEHDALVDQIRRSHGGSKPTPDAKPSLDELRAAREMMQQIALPVPDDVRMRDEELGGVPGVWFIPAGADQAKAIIYFHGGGYMFGSPWNTGHVIARLAKAAGVVAFGVDYRLSWQAPFPAPVEDAVSVYRALLARGFAPSSLVLAGDSAGGGLAIAVLVALRDAGDPLPAAGFASSPFTDLAVTGSSADTIDDPMVSKRGLLMLAQAYLDGADPKTPLASPLYADLSGLPPLLLQVGSLELLLDDSTRLAARARDAGVDVVLEVLDGVLHIWQYMGPDLPETRMSEQNAGRFLSKHLA